METNTPSKSINFFEERCELHFSVSGFWEADEMREFLSSLDNACLPLVKARKPIYVMGDFTDFVAQDQETASAIRSQLMNAVKFGLKRVAIVGASPLVKLQYKRISEGAEVGFFDGKTDALAWLREDRRAAA